jgi:hypothetical protein
MIMRSESDDKIFFHYDAERDYIEVRLVGFFSDADMAAYLDIIVANRVRLPADATGRRILYDVAEFRLQSQENFAKFAALLAEPQNQVSRVAIYVGSSPVKLQVNRLAQDNVGVFENRDEAELWLWQNM